MTYLYSKGVVLGEDGCQNGRQDEGYGVKEAYSFLQLVNGVFDNHLDEYSKPECVKLRHIIEKRRQEAHKLADLGLR